MTFLDVVLAVAGRTLSFFLFPQRFAPAKYELVAPSRSNFAVTGLLPDNPIGPFESLTVACLADICFAVEGRGGRFSREDTPFRSALCVAVAGRLLV